MAVVFGERLGKSYAVDFHDTNGNVRTWTNDRGPPHVQTLDLITKGTTMQIQKCKQQPPAKYGNVMFEVVDCSDPTSEWGGHITVPMAALN